MRWIALALLVLLLPGCSSPTPPAAAPQRERDIPAGYMEQGPAVGPDLEATTAAPPRLVAGEWWRIQFEGGVYTQEPLYRVVANATAEGYVFGMPHEGWMKEAIAYHAPAFGDVAPDLSYATHNERFTPLKFPLVAGDSWETKFAAAPMLATVESADEATAVVVFRPPPSDPDPADTAMATLMDAMGMSTDFSMRLTYDARMHEVVAMESPIGSWKVIDHGYDFVGWVSVPKGPHTAIDYGVFGPDGEHPTGTRTVDVDASFNRITVMHYLVGLTPGVFRITSTSPDGQSIATELTGPGQTFAFFEVADPGGAWTQHDFHAGLGLTYTMGIAYEQYDILVPTGERRPTHAHGVVR